MSGCAKSQLQYRWSSAGGDLDASVAVVLLLKRGLTAAGLEVCHYQVSKGSSIVDLLPLLT